MSGRVVVGVDSSTQATKVLAVDVDTGAVVGSGRAPHTVTGTGGARESDPRQWWDALCAALREALHGDPVAAIGVGGQQHGLVTLDAAGEPVRPAVLWNDTRSAPDAEELVAAGGGPAAWSARIGSVPVASFTATTWRWLRRVEPAAADRVAAVRLPHDYLTERLSGAAVTDRGDASGTGWYDAVSDRYDPGILDLIGLDPALLPRVAAPDKPVGTVTDPSLAPGLSTDTVVSAGTGDNMAAALALAAPVGQQVVSLGTSGTAYLTSPRRADDPTGVVAGFADAAGAYLPLACTLNCTLAVDRFATLLGLDRDAVEDGGEVVVLPFLDGERTPNLPRSAGTIGGLRHDTTPGQVLRAAYEGASATLLAAFDRIAETTGTAPATDLPVLLVGGGARGRTWRDTVRRLTGQAVRVPEHTELVALGAAVQAAAALTGEDPATIAGRWRTTDGVELPPAERDEAAMHRILARLDEEVARRTT